jgi:hypothetical protein
MTKYRVSIVVEAVNVPHAVSRFLYTEDGEPVEDIISVEVDSWD